MWNEILNAPSMVPGSAEEQPAWGGVTYGLQFDSNAHLPALVHSLKVMHVLPSLPFALSRGQAIYYALCVWRRFLIIAGLNARVEGVDFHQVIRFQQRPTGRSSEEDR